MKKIASFLLITFLSVLVFAQSNNKKPVGVIRGVVTTDTNSPAKKIKIVATRVGGEYESSYSTTTANDGTFRINSLPVGSYKVRATAPGYIEDSSGNRYYRTGDNVNIRLSKGGVITGTVTNRSGEPVVGIVVSARRVRTSDGELVEDQEEEHLARKATDDRGIYRIYGLQPGSYLLSVKSDIKSFFFPSPYKNMVATYYPSTNAAGAKEVSVKVGDEVSGIDIRLRETLGRSIKGKIILNEKQNRKNFGFLVKLTETATGVVTSSGY
ncbi:MAG: carboxypeptidase regulatory-like domain-containing protein, partial [Blastocatellia bacterium]|nr:carboxypeptidase regulatory-like domain-containing protein [Blastocatellia bacterium]